MDTGQQNLSPAQIEAFYSDALTEVQIQHFYDLVDVEKLRGGTVVDIGGGCGHFARGLKERSGLLVRVIDTDPISVKHCKEAGVEAECGDALLPNIRGDEVVVSFNLMLHHLVGNSENSTRFLQRTALAAWHNTSAMIFVNEYVFETHGPSDGAGRIIYFITNNRLLSAVANLVTTILPLRSLRANTFGVGVRFRSDAAWRQLFREAGYTVIDSRPGPHEPMPLLRRLLLLNRRKRRDSYLLQRAH